MPDPARAPAHGLVAAGGDLEPGTILAAYRGGIFPWPDREAELLWWSPDPRAILPLDGFHESRSLRRKRRLARFHITADRACRDVIKACADRPEGTWIIPSMIAAYSRLHELGWVHSIEVWHDEKLVGGLYGVAIGGFFAAESMFHAESDASKIAVATFVEHLRKASFELLDVQFRTDHLASLGVVEIPRRTYMARLTHAIQAKVRF